MKKLVIIFCLIFSSYSYAKTEILVDDTAPSLFSTEYDSEDLTKLYVTKNKDKHRELLDYETSISDHAKITLRITDEKQKVKAYQLLLVVVAVGSRDLDVHVYIPVNPDERVVTSKTMAKCTLKTYSDFSWENSAELLQRLNVVETDKKTTLSLKTVNKYDGPEELTECFSIQK